MLFQVHRPHPMELHIDDDEESELDLHVMPMADFEPHTEAYYCWCMPELQFKDPITGRAVWIHHCSAENPH